MHLDKFRYGFLGFGHIAEIIFTAIQKAKLVPSSQISFTQKDKKKKIATEMKHHLTAMTTKNLIEESDVIFFCVRPQAITSVFKEFDKQFSCDNKFFISVLAGTKMELFQKHLGEDIEIMRVMPNTPSSIGEGMNILSFGKNVSLDHKHIAKSIFSCMGKVEELSEKFMDTVTGISGSGPAFAFKVIDAIARLGKKEGISYEQSLNIVSQVFIGAAKMIQHGHMPEKMIDEIAVPNGTTSAGLEVYDQLSIDQSLEKAVLRSIERARELSK